jgi:DNA replicative helicase MCM subunit Mcm2 (Cdc46/Mcm family)
MIEEAPIYYTNQNLVTSDNANVMNLNNTNLKSIFRNFIHDFTKEDMRTYQAQVHKHSEQARQYLTVNLSDMKAFD